MADRVIFAALPLVGTLVCTLTPSPPVSLNVNVGLSRHAPTPMRQPHQPFHALPNTPYHRRDDWCVRRPPPPPHTLPPTHHARRDNPTFYHCFSSSVFPHPLAHLEPSLIASKIAIGPLRGPVSDPRTPSSTTPPPCHLLHSPS